MSKKWPNNPKYGFKQVSRWYLKLHAGIFKNFNFSSFYKPKCRQFGRKMTKKCRFSSIFWEKNPNFSAFAKNKGKSYNKLVVNVFYRRSVVGFSLIFSKR